METTVVGHQCYRNHRCNPPLSLSPFTLFLVHSLSFTRSTISWSNEFPAISVVAATAAVAVLFVSVLSVRSFCFRSNGSLTISVFIIGTYQQKDFVSPFGLSLAPFPLHDQDCPYMFTFRTKSAGSI